MPRPSTKLLASCLAVATLLCWSSESWARYNTGAYRRYIQQQQKVYQQYMQMEQKAMMQAVAQQMAIERHQAEMRAKASKLAHDKEEQHRQDLIAKRKSGQQAAGSTSKTVSDAKK